MRPLVYVHGKRIVVREYMDRKEEIDEFCRRYNVGYETFGNGTAVIVCD